MSKLSKENARLKKELAYYKVYDVLWVEFEAEKQLERLSLQEIQNRLNKVKDSLILLHSDYSNDDNDDRSGYDTYGYESLESIKGSLSYISDRWTCRFRIKWLLDLLKFKGEYDDK